MIIFEYFSFNKCAVLKHVVARLAFVCVSSCVLCVFQWIQCDLRFFDLSVLGKFSVVMADPPWDIHMELPYGTMSDQEMKNLQVGKLQDEGLIFLWVTGRYAFCARQTSHSCN